MSKQRANSKKPRANDGKGRIRSTTQAASSLPPQASSLPEHIAQDCPLLDVRVFRRTWQQCLARERDLINRTLELDTSESDPFLDATDLKITTNYDIIEAAIVKELERTEESDKKFNSTPPEVNNTIDFTNIPTVMSINTGGSSLKSLSDVNKLLNSNLISKKEPNYITPSMMYSNVVRDPQTGQALRGDIPSDELVIKVALFHPETNTKTQEFLVRASQKLTELRDVLYCLSDHTLDGPDTRSGYFFIENRFYSDMRDAGNLDYSKQLIEWMNDEKLKIYKKNVGGVRSGLQNVPSESKRMEEASFYDLQLRLHERYVYCHQGNCMHYIVFTEMRLVNDLDNDNAFAYPIRTFQAKIRRRKCGVCDIYPSQWVTYKDKYTADEPSFFCDTCYRKLHYDDEGKLLYSYEVFRYYHE
ncbi:snRNA-activating protein complex subunit SRD2 [Acrasis kona]|uniref:snRNA-activating protein complex subunit SRD2 n=1 Tax=Acrasis kona TaxID=1008807 RepID=A0AAW2ZEZ5_9EUKA